MAADLPVGAIAWQTHTAVCLRPGCQRSILSTVMAVRSSVISFCSFQSHTLVCRQALIWYCMICAGDDGQLGLHKAVQAAGQGTIIQIVHSCRSGQSCQDASAGSDTDVGGYHRAQMGQGLRDRAFSQPSMTYAGCSCRW